MSIIERTLLFSVVKKLCYGSGWVSRRHAAFTPAITRRGSSRAFPLPTVASLPASPSRACALRPRGHTPSAPPTDLWKPQTSQKLLDSRLRSPLPLVEEPCPLSLPYGFLTTLPSLNSANKKRQSSFCVLLFARCLTFPSLSIS